MQSPDPKLSTSSGTNDHLGVVEVSLGSEGGTFTVPVEINGQIKLDFIIDSGAADVSVPEDVVSVLMRTKTLHSDDFIGQKSYQLADGSIVPSLTFIIRSLKVVNKILDNVNASVASAKGSLLL
jgi:predicted aspartyl protease